MGEIWVCVWSLGAGWLPWFHFQFKIFPLTIRISQKSKKCVTPLVNPTQFHFQFQISPLIIRMSQKSVTPLVSHIYGCETTAKQKMCTTGFEPDPSRTRPDESDGLTVKPHRWHSSYLRQNRSLLKASVTPFWGHKISSIKGETFEKSSKMRAKQKKKQQKKKRTLVLTLYRCQKQAWNPLAPPGRSPRNCRFSKPLQIAIF